jgi:hypothetical protein
MGFKETQPKQLPKWLTGQDSAGHSEGIAFAQSFGATKDTELALLKDAVKVRWPASAPDDALIQLGRDRVILQAPVETNGQYRVKLASAHEMWLWGGTHTGIVNLFTPYDYAPIDNGVHVFNNCEVVIDGNVDWFSRVFILLELGWWAIDGAWDDPGNYDDSSLWDSNMTIADADYLRKSIRSWKSDPSYPVFIGIPLSGGSVTDDGLWGSLGYFDDGGTWNDNTDAVTYLTLGHVYGEEAWLSPGYGPGMYDDDTVYDDFVAPSGGWILPFCP